MKTVSGGRAGNIALRILAVRKLKFRLEAWLIEDCEARTWTRSSDTKAYTPSPSQHVIHRSHFSFQDWSPRTKFHLIYTIIIAIATITLIILVIITTLLIPSFSSSLLWISSKLFIRRNLLHLSVDTFSSVHEGETMTELRASLFDFWTC